MTGEHVIWRRHETRPLVKAYNSFAFVLMALAFVLTLFLIISWAPPIVSFAPILVATAFLAFIYLKDVRPELKRSSHA